MNDSVDRNDRRQAARRQRGRRTIGVGLVVLMFGTSYGSTRAAEVGPVVEPAPIGDLTRAGRVACELALPPVAASTPGPSGLRRFSDDEFQRLVDLFGPSRIATDAPPPIVGDETVDSRIRSIAEARGYRRRGDPGAGDLVFTSGELLTPGTASAWRSMADDARGDGISLTLWSAYRSVLRQRAIFVGKLRRQGMSNADVRSGRADGTIDSILRFSSIPGYSRHHTGTTVDVVSGGSGLSSFRSTAAYRWMSADNFANAKRHGFVPSYPAAAGRQGPDPEPWEFVHIGTDLIDSSRSIARIDVWDVGTNWVRVEGVPGQANDTLALYLDETQIGAANATCAAGLPAGSFRIDTPFDRSGDLCVVQHRPFGLDQLVGCRTV